MPPTLFVNDGSFMERFKQLEQKQKDKKGSTQEESRPINIVSGTLTPNSTAKTSVEFKSNDKRKNTQTASSGKLAFSLKQKSKLVAPPVKLGADDDEDETDTGNASGDAPIKRQKLGKPDVPDQSSARSDVGNYCFYSRHLSDYVYTYTCMYLCIHIFGGRITI